MLLSFAETGELDRAALHEFDEEDEEEEEIDEADDDRGELFPLLVALGLLVAELFADEVVATVCKRPR